MGGSEHLTSWKGKVREVLVAALGKDDHLVDRFDSVRYTLRMSSSSTPQSRHDQARHVGIRNTCGIIDAAVYKGACKWTTTNPSTSVPSTPSSGST